MDIVIIEDEPLARDQMLGFVRAYDPRIEVVATLDSVESTVAWLRSHRAPDLVLADISLADGNVFQALEQAPLVCPIVFTTAHDDYLLQAFEQNGIAYLLKPIEYEDFATAMRKYDALKRAFSRLDEGLASELQRALTRPSYRQRLVVRQRDGIVLLDVADIACIRMVDQIASAFDGSGREFVLRETLSQLEQQLDPRSFFRVNRSEIVHARFIERLEPFGADRLLIHLRGLPFALHSSVKRTPSLRQWLEH